jgi:hypothetical protein
VLLYPPLANPSCNDPHSLTINPSVKRSFWFLRRALQIPHVHPCRPSKRTKTKAKSINHTNREVVPHATQYHAVFDGSGVLSNRSTVNHPVSNGEALLSRFCPLADALCSALLALGLNLRWCGSSRSTKLASIVKVALAWKE